MYKEEAIYLGRLVKYDKKQGFFLFLLDNEIKEKITVNKLYVDVNGGELVPFLLSEIKFIDSKRFLVKFNSIYKEEEIMLFTKNKWYCESFALEERQENLLGYKIYDKKLSFIGKVKEVKKLPYQKIIICSYKSNELMIPYTYPIILKRDDNKKIIFTDLPDGLTDINN